MTPAIFEPKASPAASAVISPLGEWTSKPSRTVQACMARWLRRKGMLLNRSAVDHARRAYLMAGLTC